MSAFRFATSTGVNGRTPFCFSGSALSVCLVVTANTALGVVPRSGFVFPTGLISCLGRRRIAFIF